MSFCRQLELAALARNTQWFLYDDFHTLWLRAQTFSQTLTYHSRIVTAQRPIIHLTRPYIFRLLKN